MSPLFYFAEFIKLFFVAFDTFCGASNDISKMCILFHAKVYTSKQVANRPLCKWVGPQIMKKTKTALF